MVTVTIKKDAFNTSLRYNKKNEAIIKEAEKEAKTIFKDFDCILIYIYFLVKDGLKDVKLHLKNDYAKQLKRELQELLKIK